MLPCRLLISFNMYFNEWCKKKQMNKYIVKIGGLGRATENQVQSNQWQTWNKSTEAVIIWERMALKHEHNISQESVKVLSC